MNVIYLLNTTKIDSHPFNYLLPDCLMLTYRWNRDIINTKLIECFLSQWIHNNYLCHVAHGKISQCSLRNILMENMYWNFIWY